MEQEIKFLLIISAMVVVIVFGLVWIFTMSSCHSRANALGIPSSFGPLQGCIVEWKGEKIPLEAIGVRAFRGNEGPGR